MSDRSATEPWAAKIAHDGPPMHQERARQTRQLIMRAAAHEFAANGFRNTSLQAVAKRAEITKGAIYHHFTNKENLAASVVEEHYALWPALVSEAGAAGLPPLDTVIHLLDKVAVTFRDDPLVQASARLQIERSTIGIPLPTPFVGWTRLLTDLLRGAAEAGQLRPGCAPEVAARVIVAAFFGVQHISDALHDREDIVERWQEVKDVLLPSLRA
ncbi:ScbR family autoregulator-binding transcription factor [Streptomyces sp. NPDC001903]|uniref:ScbR family autoregulator-binding transcription factor n=1 Tax=Streptomyces sp. NPDC001903 TaxID=3364622 RepID=UPI0036C10866